MSQFPVHFFKLNPGDDIMAAIENYVKKQGWQEAYVQGAIGSAVDVVFSNPTERVLPPPIHLDSFEGPVEILSLVGEIIRQEDGEYFIHVHASGSLRDTGVHGGGLRQARVFRQMKIYLQQVA